MDRIASIDELLSPDTLHIRIIGSTVPSGTIRTTNLPAPEKGLRFFSSADIPGKKTIRVFDTDIPILVEDRVNYQGEAVLLAASADPNLAAYCARQVRVEYDTDYTLKTFDKPDDENIIKMKIYRRGNSTGALQEATKIIEDEFRLPAMTGKICGTIAAWAQMTDGKLSVWVTSAWIHHVKTSIASALDMDEKKITVHALPFGRSMDTLSWYPSIPAIYAALCAYHTGKSGCIILQENEKNDLIPKSLPVRAVFKTGLSADGALLGREIDIDLDAGAYSIAPNMILDRVCLASTGVYNCPNFSIHGRLIRTSKPPHGICCGGGVAAIITAAEAHATKVALSAGKDPLTFRRDSLKAPYEHTAGLRQKRNLLCLQDLLEITARKSDYLRKFGAFELNRKKCTADRKTGTLQRGIGLAVAFTDSGFSGLGENELNASVGLRLESDGILTIMASSLPEHENTGNIWKKTAGSILGVAEKNIRDVYPNTDTTPDAGPAIFSRNMTIIRSLVSKAAGSIQRKRFRAPLPITVKKTYKLPKSVTWDTNTLKGDLFHLLTWAVWVVEVGYDPILLRPVITGIWGTIDCGRVLDYDAARSAVEEEVLAALEVTSESEVFPAGDTSVPLFIDFIEHGSGESSGISGCAKPGVSGAFLSAVIQASNHRIDSLPVGAMSFFDQRGKL